MAGTDISTMLAVMDVRDGTSTALASGTQPTVLCCTCGAPIVWNPSSMCSNCIRTRVDISEGIPKSVPLQWCRACGRYLNPPKHWMACQLESKELLQVCIKRLKGLNKVKLVDAAFIWTEPHSRRLKVQRTNAQSLLLPWAAPACHAIERGGGGVAHTHELARTRRAHTQS